MEEKGRRSKESTTDTSLPAFKKLPTSNGTQGGKRRNGWDSTHNSLLPEQCNNHRKLKPSKNFIAMQLCAFQLHTCLALNVCLSLFNDTIVPLN